MTPTQMRITQIFTVDNFNDPDEIDWLRRETHYFLQKMEACKDEFLVERLNPVLSPASLEQFFRHRERCEKTCQILHYLLTFTFRIPAGTEIQDAPVNPAEQFREFIRYETDLLLEEDVKNAVFKETNHKRRLTGKNVWDYQERIVTLNRDLNRWVAQDNIDVSGTISILCRVLEQLCLFWFEIRQHDISRTRRSDIFLYLLARLVQHRCQQIKDE
jgi:hypothetical protein